MKKIYAFLLITALTLSQMSAQDWTKLNLPETGKHVTSMMEADDGTLYVATAQGLFESADNALTWNLVNRGMKHTAMTVTENGKPICLNTTQLLSVDDSEVLELFWDLGFTIVQFTPNMLTADDGSLHLLYGQSLQMKYFLSTDDGATFSQQNYDEPPIFEGFKPAPLFKNPTNGDLFYFAENNTLQRSTDNGSSFSTVGSELNVFSFNEKPFTVDPVTGALYYLSNQGNQPIVQKSTDHGATWTDVSSGNTFGDGIGAYNGELIIWGGNDIFHSPDDGVTWNNVSDLFGTQRIPDRFFISSTGKFFGMNIGSNLKVSDAVREVDFVAGTVTRRTNGLDFTLAQGLASNGERISASLSEWAHYTDDNGETWTALKGEGANSHQTYVANDGTIYAEKWANGIFDGVYVQNEEDSMVQVLDNNGASILEMKYMFEDDSDNMYIVSFEKLYKSENGGAFTELPNAPIESLNHRDMWYSSSLGRIFSITGTGEAHYSDDQGETWTVSQPLGGISQNHFAGVDEVWAFNLSTDFAEQGYYQSSDLQDWTQITSTFENNTEGAFGLDDMTIISRTDNEIILSEDAGLTWEAMIDGIELAEMYDWQGLTESVNTTELERTPGRMLLAANGGIYLWEYDDVSTNVENLSTESGLKLYPNPLSKGSTLNINHAGQNLNQIQVIDLSGKRVYTGRISDFDNNSLNSGMYQVLIMDGLNTISRKLIIQ